MFETYNSLGGHLQEKHYQRALAKALEEREITFKEQFQVSIYFNNHKVENYFLDFLVEDKIIIELKVKPVNRTYYDQLLSYLKETEKKLGIVAVFGSEELRFRRVANLY